MRIVCAGALGKKKIGKYEKKKRDRGQDGISSQPACGTGLIDLVFSSINYMQFWSIFHFGFLLWVPGDTKNNIPSLPLRGSESNVQERHINIV